MSSILGPFTRIINETATALIDNQIPKRVADVISTSLSSGSEVVADLLKIAKDLTEEQET